MEDIWLQIGNYGFPIVVALYLLVRVEQKLDASPWPSPVWNRRCRFSCALRR